MYIASTGGSWAKEQVQGLQPRHSCSSSTGPGASAPAPAAPAAGGRSSREVLPAGRRSQACPGPEACAQAAVRTSAPPEQRQSIRARAPHTREPPGEVKAAGPGQDGAGLRVRRVGTWLRLRGQRFLESRPGRWDAGVWRSRSPGAQDTCEPRSQFHSSTPARISRSRRLTRSVIGR